jgi:hypothetical protein
MRDLQLRLQPFDNGCGEWEQFLADCPQATLYHHRPWLRALQQVYGLDLQFILMMDAGSNEPLAGGVFSRSRSLMTRKLVSLPFSDSCSLAAREPDLLPSFVSSLSEGPFSSWEIEIRGYRAAPPWHILTTFVEWTLDLDKPAAELHRAMDTNFRRQLRRGEEGGFEIRIGRGLEEIRAFYELMLLTRTRFGLPAQPLGFFEVLSEIYKDNCEIWLLSKDGNDLVGMFLLREGDELYYKWSARADPMPAGANHVLIWRMLEAHAGHFRTLNLGRNDASNVGISRFKTELGADSTVLPYSFFPRGPAAVSAEQLAGARAMLARVWRRIPVSVARHLGPPLYKLLG